MDGKYVPKLSIVLLRFIYFQLVIKWTIKNDGGQGKLALSSRMTLALGWLTMIPKSVKFSVFPNDPTAAQRIQSTHIHMSIPVIIGIVQIVHVRR